jgi:methionyl-tRNA formyltransferase
MRFAITAVDRNLSVLDGLLAAGWEPIKLFTMPSNGATNLSRAVIDRAVGLGVPVQLSRLLDDDLQALRGRLRGAGLRQLQLADWRLAPAHALCSQFPRFAAS